MPYRLARIGVPPIAMIVGQGLSTVRYRRRRRGDERRGIVRPTKRSPPARRSSPVAIALPMSLSERWCAHGQQQVADEYPPDHDNHFRCLLYRFGRTGTHAVFLHRGDVAAGRRLRINTGRDNPCKRRASLAVSACVHALQPGIHTGAVRAACRGSWSG
jgi:hypothetical protein